MISANFVKATVTIAEERAQKNGAPLVAHIIHRFAVGGLENGLVNLINGTAIDRYRHAVICLTDNTDFRNRIRQPDVPVIALHKRTGKDFRTHLRLWRILRVLRPAIVHTRNLPALEYLSVAALARVRGRLHGEHGRDMYDLDGSRRKYILLRKLLDPFVSHYTAVSEELSKWLGRVVGQHKVTHVCNGVDTQRFHPRKRQRLPLGSNGFARPGTIIIGTVGRMQIVKDPLNLVRAFIRLLQDDPGARECLRLVMIGDGPLRGDAQKLLCETSAEAFAWLPGERDNIPQLMRAIDLFVLPSIAEGVSNTILEAMASGLPVIATNVGGNPELVVDGETGMLVPPSNPAAMADAINSYLKHPVLLGRHGEAGRKRVEMRFNIESMVNGYLDVYDAVLRATTRSNSN
jgi:sugar transferase (PEP-CTERM/EpsH1 system associated)